MGLASEVPCAEALGDVEVGSGLVLVSVLASDWRSQLMMDLRAREGSEGWRHLRTELAHGF
jgi:hypothetical protein